MSLPHTIELEVLKPDLHHANDSPEAIVKISPTMQKDTAAAQASTRFAYFNQAEKHLELNYSSNNVITSKYSVVSFVPKTLFEQFQRIANIFFLVVSGLQVFTDLSPTGKYTTAGPLAVVILFSMLREAYEDRARHVDDASVNSRLVLVLNRNSQPVQFEEKAWRDVVVGDIVRVLNRSEFPADLLLLSSTGDQGMCYIDTCNLDGETNLKIRSAVSATSHFTSSKALSLISGNIEYDAPNNKLYNFTGTLTLDQKKFPVDNEAILLRGSILRNTDWIHGFVLYTGDQSKIMMNSRSSRNKRSNMEHTINRLLLLIAAFFLLFCVISSLLYNTWTNNNQGVWYLPYVIGISTAEKVKNFFVYFILYNNFIPISLYVTIEVVKVAQAKLMGSDINMYHADSDTPMVARTSNLNEELGQIEYIFSDKTGTLTRNQMEFRKCSIAGCVYGYGTTEVGLAAAKRRARTSTASQDEPDKVLPEYVRLERMQRAHVNFDPTFTFDDRRLIERLQGGHESSAKIREFLVALATCQTVVPEKSTATGKIVYQSESPDEGALVFAAQCFGFFFKVRKASFLTVEEFDVGDQEYEVLNVNKFNSKRKRMSIVLRRPNGSIVLFCKGADSVMMQRIQNSSADDQVQRDLDTFASEGLRTLLLAKRELSDEAWRRWNKVYQAASVSLNDRDLALESAAEEVEISMEILGSTAIEDKLQIGVPDAISRLAAAKIKIWVLTGDKEETAINIGFACQLLDDTMDLTIVNQRSSTDILRVLKAMQNKIETARKSMDTFEQKFALVVDGESLIYITREDELTLLLMNVTRYCVAVIACRVSPKQKADVVSLVKTNMVPCPMTLSIGDGANDVPMIQEAHVGIGISGNEGMQAVRAADYAIAQFRFLENLLLQHGRMNYRRIAIVILYSFYKNCVLVTMLFWFNFFNGFSGSALLNGNVQAMYNVIFTSFPIIAFGVLDRDVEFKSCSTYPVLYQSGQLKEGFNIRKMTIWMLSGVVHSLALMFITAHVNLGRIISTDGINTADRFAFGNQAGNYLVIVVNLKLILETSYFANINAAVYLLTLFSYIVIVTIMQAFPATIFDVSGSGPYSFGVAQYWLMCALMGPLALILDLAYMFQQKLFKPNTSDQVKEIQLQESHNRGPSPQQVSPSAKQALSQSTPTKVVVQSRSALGSERVADTTGKGSASPKSSNRSKQSTRVGTLPLRLGRTQPAPPADDYDAGL